MIDRLEALILGLVQGVTEFLPVSSSGHLVIGQNLFGLRGPSLLFDVVLHVATLLVVVWYYRGDLATILRQSGAGLGALGRGGSWSAVQQTFPQFRIACLIGVGTIPTAVIGLVFEGAFERLFASPRAAALMLMLTGLWLSGLALLPRHTASGEGRRAAQMRYLDALLVGLAQGLALAPGISRSGLTIGAALLLGVERETAARFSFLLSIPSILGALVLRLGEARGGIGWLATSLGFLAALVSGYVALALLVRVVKQGRLYWFAPYCLAVGLAALLAL